jgi:hypothetical protein
MLFKGKPPSKPNLRKTSQTKMRRDADSDDDLDEYRDIVFDFDESKALVQAADDFLKGNDESELQSNNSIKSKNGKFVEANIRSAGSYNALLKQRNVDRLDPVAKAKLDRMLRDIDDNLDEL